MTRNEAGRLIKRAAGLTLAEKCIFLFLLEGADNHDCAVPDFQTPTMRQLAEWTGLHLRTVQKAVAHLELHGWMIREIGRGRGRKTRYQLVPRTPDPGCDCRKRRSQGHPQKAVPAAPIQEEKAVPGPPSGPEKAVPTPGEKAALGSTFSQVGPEIARRATKGGGRRGAQQDQPEEACVGPECTRPARRGCRTCWDHAAYEQAAG